MKIKKLNHLDRYDEYYHVLEQVDFQESQPQMYEYLKNLVTKDDIETGIFLYIENKDGWIIGASHIKKQQHWADILNFAIHIDQRWKWYGNLLFQSTCNYIKQLWIKNVFLTCSSAYWFYIKNGMTEYWCIPKMALSWNDRKFYYKKLS